MQAQIDKKANNNTDFENFTWMFSNSILGVSNHISLNMQRFPHFLDA